MLLCFKSLCGVSHWLGSLHHEEEKMKPFTPAHAKNLHAAKASGDTLAVEFHYREARYTLWFKEGIFTADAIYKDPPLGIEPPHPAHFETRKLDPEKSFGRAVLAWVFPQLDALRAAVLDEALEERALLIEAEDRLRLRESAPALLAALRTLMREHGITCDCQPCCEAHVAITLATDRPAYFHETTR
jgi:hypothetical protein